MDAFKAFWELPMFIAAYLFIEMDPVEIEWK